ncbi:LacI family DNA-binding transcriptional regulator [Paraburkholderia sp. MMS20-SJTR3]|uniref:LacI family DNA-binding transcriptional regulator n=1 Tax=Paraburkholderia sejongensis TaxID=2886946 RepID=A0ABS8K0F3_9BURK|nr:LacI family DNA-binding transcriptional regulator [Paraburkholderia sp. MMS20-SJTR3]MCC8395637.1 LacI family DNA-binding transcriptional regulator [Paraburkholderia sp. MMS20-SJTR3]
MTDHGSDDRSGAPQLPEVPLAPNVTLEEIARAAGVSPSTVSRILNGTARVLPAKQQAVEEAIARFNYRPNILARGLASGRTETIGVLTQAVSSPFYAEWLRGIEEALYEPGFTPIFVSSRWNLADEKARLEQLIARRVDGIILLHAQLDEATLTDYARWAPMLVLGRSVQNSAALAGLPIDNLQGARDATRHLIEQGHREIAFIAGPSNHEDAIERLDGYRSALIEAGIGFDPELVEQGDYLETGGVAAMERLIARHPSFSAVFCANDQTAYGARLAMFRRGVRVPDDVSLVGFDDLPTSSYMTPPLTTVRQPTYEIGRLAAQGIVRMIRKQSIELSPIPLTLVARETTRRIAPPLSRGDARG